MIEWIPNKIFGSNTGSFDRSADQTASGYVNTPINNNHIITTLGFSQIFIKWKIMIGGKILESRELRIENWELRETRRRRGRRRRWLWRYRWRRRCRGTPLRGRGPTCPDMLLCLTWSNLICCSQMWFFDFWISLSLFFPVVSYLLFVGQRSSGHSSIGLNVLRAAHP